MEWTVDNANKKGKKTTETIEMSKSFYDVWSEDPNMTEYMEIVFNCNLKKVKKTQFNMLEVLPILIIYQKKKLIWIWYLNILEV